MSEQVKKPTLKYRVELEKRLQINKSYKQRRNRAIALRILSYALFGQKRFQNLYLSCSLNCFYWALQIANVLHQRVPGLAMIVKFDVVTVIQYYDGNLENGKSYLQKKYTKILIKLTRNPTEEDKKEPGFNAGLQSSNITNELTEVMHRQNRREGGRVQNRGGRYRNNNRNRNQNNQRGQGRGQRRTQNRGQGRRQNRENRQNRQNQGRRQRRQRDEQRQQRPVRRQVYGDDRDERRKYRQPQENNRNQKYSRNNEQQQRKYQRGQQRTRGTGGSNYRNNERKQYGQNQSRYHEKQRGEENNRQRQDRGNRNPRRNNRYSQDDD